MDFLNVEVQKASYFNWCCWLRWRQQGKSRLIILSFPTQVKPDRDQRDALSKVPFFTTLLKPHHQSSISCHSLKLRSEQILVKRKGHILPSASAQLDSLLVTLCQETAIWLFSLPCDWFSQWEVLMWPLQYPCPLDTCVGQPTPIRLLSVSTKRQTYLRSCQVS